MTKEGCLDYINESLSVVLDPSDLAIISNAIDQYTTDLSMAIIRSSTATFSDLVSRAIMEARK